MSLALIPFDAAKLPAHIKAGAVANPFAAAVSAGGFPAVSIKGKVFHIIRGDERTLVTKPDADDEPAASLELVILGSNPHKSKVFYATGYEEGSAAKPDCYSNDGQGPAADAQTPQAKKCALCPHNAWGSRVSESGKQGKACADSMRLAVAPAGLLNDPMLLRVPAASLRTLGEYGAMLAKRGVAPHQVVTKIGFDYTVAHPALTFKAVGFVTDAMVAEIMETQQSDVVAQITGTAAAPLAEDNEAFEQAAPAEPAPAKPAKAKKSASPEAAEPVVEVKVEAAAPAPAPAEPAPKKAEPAVATVQELAAALDDIDFDD